MITVFTPTYNRAHTLPALFRSLQAQTATGFEWMIVDDGSTDGTEGVVAGFERENPVFPIVYRKQPNGGKHAAINYGAGIARGTYFFIVDSDDFLPPDAVEIVERHTAALDPSGDICGIIGLKVFADLRNVGGDLPAGIPDTDFISYRYRYRVRGDKAEVVRTSVMREFPFPVFPGERFCSEALVWFRIARKYKVRPVPEKIYICEYLDDGLTHSIVSHYRNSPCGTMLYYREMAAHPLPPVARLKAAVNYWRYTAGYRKKRPAALRPFGWMYLAYPLGLFFYFRDSRRLKKRRR